ncbi:hypothetical protein SAMN04490244_101297 [Tranquillimonas rosea]|uniref:Uncharacterized protein n=1 Tax=Tranquillimonas rosea TaxID=641238 RepID=A0A1H9PSB6_9RHOB|nr:hypothetical protein [Tranquillimonas rosea]SER50679.1 hypothetical protein SAMN04490244_101297 [Tranquillimonas rosea]
MSEQSLTDSRFWLLMPLRQRTLKAHLEKMLEEMPDKYRGDRYLRPTTKAAMIELIQKGRDRYWNDQQSRAPAALSRPGRHRRRKVAADLCDIPASECNEWLRSLPEPNLS